MTDYLPHRSLLRLLTVLVLVTAPHALHLPWWESLAVAGLLVWRALASARQWSLPPQPLKLALAIAAFAAVYAVYGRVTGQNAGIALLVLMLALKLTEMRSRRDVMVVVFLMYFLLVTHFLYSQELWTVLYLFASSVAITAVLIDAHHPGEPLPLRESLRLGGRMILQSLPLMLLFFVLFPRIPGPLWGLPSDAGPTRSGLSDSMSPGDISQLILSDEVAFRVSFEGPPPSPDKLYWRGPVFTEFNGRTWTASSADLTGRLPAQIERLGEEVRYELTLEPMRSRWLLALDIPDTRALPERARLDRNGSLVMDRPIIERRLIRGVSHARYRLDAELGELAREQDTEYPPWSNPRAQDLAAQWRAQGLDDGGVINAALRMFREQEFIYTLEPPMLGRNSVDEFLFETRKGFCEHYTSAFVLLMRAAGVPARVITGYQGMERNTFSDYYVVRQSDAHAWAEVWLQGRGWVRVDPTAAVAPERIERGMRETLRAASEGLPGFFSGYSNWREQMQDSWDMVNAYWNGWVLGYGPEVQQLFLSFFGLDQIRNMILALTAGVTAVLAWIGFAALRRAQAPRITEPALRLWKRATARLGQLGFKQRPDEGPRDFVQRVTEREPTLTAPLQQILDAYLRLRYASEQNPALERRIIEAIKRLRRPS